MKKQYNTKDIDWKNSTEVCVKSNSSRFVLFVPPLDGGKSFTYPSHYPNNAYIKEEFKAKAYDKAGKNLTDYKDQEIEGKGFVFFNYKDNAFQGVSTDGEGVIIFNGLSKDQEEKLKNIIDKNLSNKKIPTIKDFENILEESLKIEAFDRYNSDINYTKNSLTKIKNNEPNENYAVFLKNNEIYQAVYLEGPLELKSAATTHQFLEVGGIALKEKNKGLEATRGIQVEDFKNTYCFLDGKEIQKPNKEIISAKFSNENPSLSSQGASKSTATDNNVSSEEKKNFLKTRQRINSTSKEENLKKKINRTQKFK